MHAKFCTQQENGVLIKIKVQTRSSRKGLLGVPSINDQHLKWGLSQAPIDGKANQELIAGIAKFFGIAKNSVEIIRGHKTTLKQVHLAGVNFDKVFKKVLGL
jgi:uncharacterized protein (TIGR00251 family)